MRWFDAVAGYRPRRAEGLPPGQREVARFPRFSDEPLRWAPAEAPIDLQVTVDGEEQMRLGAQELSGFDQVERTHDFSCVTTWTYRNVRWRGVPLADALAAGFGSGFASELPRYAVVRAADTRTGIYLTEDLCDPSVLLATEMNGEPLSRRHGAPLRIIAPLQYGYKSAKHIVGIDFVVAKPDSTMGSKEHLRARIELEERHSKLPAWMVRVPYRMTVVPTALAADRGLRNSP